MNPRDGPPLPTDSTHPNRQITLHLHAGSACSSNALPYPEANRPPVARLILTNYLSFNGLTRCLYGSCDSTFVLLSPYLEANSSPRTSRISTGRHRLSPKALRTGRQRFRTPSKALRTRGQRSPYCEATRSVLGGQDLRTPRQRSPYPEAKDRRLTPWKQRASDLLNRSQVLPTEIQQHSTGEGSKSTTSSVPTAPTPRSVVVCALFFYQNGPCL
jgi:hypothetical protein